MTAINLNAHPRMSESSMRSSARTPASVWVGRVLSSIAILFLSFDLVVKLLLLPQAVDGTVQLGYPADVIRPLGILQLVLLVLYLVPRTSLLGAVLWTGYLGGAVATHVRLGNPLFTHILFPVYVGALLWGGLWLRDQRARAVFSA